MRHSEKEWEKISRMRRNGINDFCVQNDSLRYSNPRKRRLVSGSKMSFSIVMGVEKKGNKKDRKMIPVYYSSNSQLQILSLSSHSRLLMTTSNNRLSFLSYSYLPLHLLPSLSEHHFFDFLCVIHSLSDLVRGLWGKRRAGVQFMPNVLFDRLSNPESDE